MTTPSTQRLAAAESELGSAVADYDQLIASEAERESIEAAQIKLEAAKQELGHLSEELLASSLPSRTPSASLVADWLRITSAAAGQLFCSRAPWCAAAETTCAVPWR